MTLWGAVFVFVGMVFLGFFSKRRNNMTTDVLSSLCVVLFLYAVQPKTLWMMALLAFVSAMGLEFVIGFLDAVTERKR